MNKIVSITLFLWSSFFCGFAQHPQQNPNWVTMFCDNFATLNPQRWQKELGVREEGKPTEEVCVRTADNVYIQDNQLILRVKRDTLWHANCSLDSCMRDNGWHYFSSGAVSTPQRYSFGYFEISAKLPSSSGYWPAFWLWESEDDLYYNEIDIFEAYGSIPDSVESNAHWNPLDISEGTVRQHFLPNYSAGFHWYGLAWTSTRITWFIDRKQVRSIPNNFQGTCINHPMHIIINIGLETTSSERNPPTATTIVPNYMYIDQANVYRLKCDSEAVVNEISNFQTFNFAVKKSISLSGNTTLPRGGDVSLYATDFIQLNNGFEIPLGTTFFADVTSCPF